MPSGMAPTRRTAVRLCSHGRRTAVPLGSRRMSSSKPPSRASSSSAESSCCPTARSSTCTNSTCSNPTGPSHRPPCNCCARPTTARVGLRSEEHTSELQSQSNLVCRLLLEKKKKKEIKKKLCINRIPKRAEQESDNEVHICE